ncbi:Protein jagunal, partial [Stegodyphus mimosarum]
MASKGGARAKGTDGTDYGHRETIASHYQISSTNKRRLKITIVLHMLLLIFVILKLSTEILQFVNISPMKFYDIKFPKAILWEWVWLSSIIFTLAAFYGLRKNNVIAMKVYSVGIFVCGIIPLVGAIAYHSGDLKVFLLSDNIGTNVEKFRGVPVVLITCIFVSITFLVHSLSIVFAVNLIRAWT